jgi:hypothetical protein
MSYPALLLTSLDGSFMPKRISLAGGEHATIGRTMNDETNPTEGNGRFDTKVLSRQHAEVYEQDGKVCSYLHTRPNTTNHMSYVDRFCLSRSSSRT